MKVRTPFSAIVTQLLIAAAIVPVAIAGSSVSAQPPVYEHSPGAQPSSPQITAAVSVDLARADPEQELQLGEVLGVKVGQVLRDTLGAEAVLVVLEASALPKGSIRLALVGVVQALVVGKVQAGDYILASGNADGYGVAIKPEAMTVAGFQQLVGRAWESSEVEQAKLIKVAVGLGASDARGYLLKQEGRIAELERQLKANNQENGRMIAQIDQLTKRINKLQMSLMSMGVIVPR